MFLLYKNIILKNSVDSFKNIKKCKLNVLYKEIHEINYNYDTLVTTCSNRMNHLTFNVI